MPSIITNLAATTELEAVNLMLSAIGESPVTAIDRADANVDMALNILTDTTREVLAEGWRFNQEFGLAIAPEAPTLAWTDPDGTERTLNVFTPPTGLCRWRTSFTSEQYALDLSVRPGKEYTTKPLVFYDRTANRDGLIAADFPLLYIDAIWFLDFEKLPDTARRYIIVSAGRKFIADTTADANRFGFKEQDELKALRALKRDHGDDDEASLLDHTDVSDFFGGRAISNGRWFDLRNTP